ncbi:MAG: hypothetical protein Q7V63_05850 [Gammaproteobacteria bacterium]|nr:hypothetical protein [Gammaproteobacteria bacterium]
MHASGAELSIAKFISIEKFFVTVFDEATNKSTYVLNVPTTQKMLSDNPADGSLVLALAGLMGDFKGVEFLFDKGVSLGESYLKSPIYLIKTMQLPESIIQEEIDRNRRSFIRYFLGRRETRSLLNFDFLSEAVDNNDLELFVLLQDSGYDLKMIESSTGKNLLHVAVLLLSVYLPPTYTTYALNPLYAKNLEARLGIIEILLGRGLDVNLVDNKLLTPLHKASLSYRRILSTAFVGFNFINEGQMRVMSLLLKHGAKLLCMDAEGMTPVHYVCSMPDGGVLVDFILSQPKARESLFIFNKEGQTPLARAATFDSIEAVEKILIKLFPDTLTKKQRLKIWDSLAGKILLFDIAIVHWNIKLIKLLFGYAAPCKMPMGLSALHYAAKKYSTISKIRQEDDSSKEILSIFYHADPHALDIKVEGRSPRHFIPAEWLREWGVPELATSVAIASKPKPTKAKALPLSESIPEAVVLPSVIIDKTLEGPEVLTEVSVKPSGVSPVVTDTYYQVVERRDIENRLNAYRDNFTKLQKTFANKAKAPFDESKVLPYAQKLNKSIKDLLNKMEKNGTDVTSLRTELSLKTLMRDLEMPSTIKPITSPSLSATTPSTISDRSRSRSSSSLSAGSPLTTLLPEVTSTKSIPTKPPVVPIARPAYALPMSTQVARAGFGEAAFATKCREAKKSPSPASTFGQYMPSSLTVSAAADSKLKPAISLYLNDLKMLVDSFSEIKPCKAKSAIDAAICYNLSRLMGLIAESSEASVTRRANRIRNHIIHRPSDWLKGGGLGKLIPFIKSLIGHKDDTNLAALYSTIIESSYFASFTVTKDETFIEEGSALELLDLLQNKVLPLLKDFCDQVKVVAVKEGLADAEHAAILLASDDISGKWKFQACEMALMVWREFIYQSANKEGLASLMTARGWDKDKECQFWALLKAMRNKIAHYDIADELEVSPADLFKALSQHMSQLNACMLPVTASVFVEQLRFNAEAVTAVMP